ncbi:hypothetical protein FN846DRAFT_907137 [Sphaerosporella brunnea]|uniref:Uncharacterized protein n=1 Tax=Sphaerosporella brunnea TaxID=1250544 RepID=A0A5J5EXD7_9PEZI|nr:hypothetical protein FN846DRAFT_907137 [Sphaerosporella brunnea]
MQPVPLLQRSQLPEVVIDDENEQQPDHADAEDGNRLCSDRGSHDTCRYDTESNIEQVRPGSQTDHTATKDLDGNNRMDWSDLRKTPGKLDKQRANLSMTIYRDGLAG